MKACSSAVALLMKMTNRFERCLDWLYRTAVESTRKSGEALRSTASPNLLTTVLMRYHQAGLRLGSTLNEVNLTDKLA